MEKKNIKPDPFLTHETIEPIRKCPECSSKNIIKDSQRAEIFCADCGLILVENIVDLGPEWRAYDFEQAVKRARTGSPMTYRIHDKGLGTIITWPWSSSSQGHCELKRWQQQRMYVVNSTERSLIYALSEIERMACALKIPVDIREESSVLCRRIIKKELIRGRSIEALTSALLYIVCRQCKVPRTLEEISDVSRVELKKINRAYRFLLRELEIKLAPASPVDFVPRFCTLLYLDRGVQLRAIEIIKRADEAGLNDGRSPIGSAGAAIYIAAMLSGEHKSQKELADVTGVTEVTIRSRYKELSKELDIEN